MSKQRNTLVPVAGLESRIHLLRQQKVMFDFDLARLYGVETKALKRAVKRNFERFPDDFLFQLTRGELTNLRRQIGTSSLHGGTRYLPYAFTQEGIAMLSSVLHSPRAAAVNVEIMRAFVRLRGFLSSQSELARQLARLEKRTASHDEAIRKIFQAIKQLMAGEITPPRRREIGFHTQMVQSVAESLPANGRRRKKS